MSVSTHRSQPVKHTPPHLTSAAAEQILSQACDNEVQNAARIRVGLEPLPVQHRYTTLSHLLQNVLYIQHLPYLRYGERYVISASMAQ